MIHQMKLLEDPFDRIKNGIKTIEFRLFDEKRRLIKIGDKIEFSKLPDLKEKILVDVLDLYYEKSFTDLFEKIYSDDKEEINKKIESIYKIYTKENEEKYGVLGIKIKLDVDNLKKQINEFKPFNEQEEQDKRIMLKYFEDFDDVLTRQNEYGHFTASAFVLNKERTKILMIYHNIYDSWTWVGGHSDGDNDLLYVALKEAKEETGLTEVRPIIDEIYSLEIINVNGHFKRGKYVSSHVHLNLTYLLEADETEIVKIKEDENSGVEWTYIEDVIEKSSEKWIKEEIFSKIIKKMEKDKIINRQ